MMGNRTLAMGDIHGNLRALTQCLKRAAFNPERDTLIQIGDIVDGHPESALVVQRLMELPNLIAIRGNHDVWCMNWLKHGSKTMDWIRQGGRATLDSYATNKDAVDLIEHREFFKSQKNFYIDQHNRLFIHAGYSSSNGPEYEEYEHTLYWDRELWQSAIDSKDDGNLPEFLNRFNEIIIGHTSTQFWNTDQPMKACNVWNLDTGAGWNGRLTIMDVDTKDYWQSDLAKELYTPKESPNAWK